MLLQFEDFFELWPDILCIVGPDGCFKRVNSALRSLLGYTEEELLARPVADFFHPDDRPLNIQWQKVLGTGKPLVNLESRCLCKDGSYRWLAWNVCPVAAEGMIGASARDVTDYKKMIEALQKSHDFCLALIDGFPNPMWRSGIDGKCDYVNKSWLDFTGRTMEQEVGYGWIEGVHPEDLDRYVTTHLDALNAQKPFKIEYRLRHRSGKYRYILNFATPFYGRDGSFLGHIGSCYDVSGRKQMEQALQESETKYRTIFENTGTAMAIIEEDTTISLVNSEFEKLTGYTREETEGKKSWTELVVQEDVERMKEYHRLRRVDPNGAPRNYVFRSITKEGKIKYLYATVTVIPGTRKSVESLLDITESKQAEERLKQRLKMEKLVADISANLISLTPNEIDNGINVALRAIGEFAGADRSYVFLFASDRTKMDNTHEWCAEGIEPQIDNLKGLPTETFAWWMRQLKEFKPIYIPSVEELPSGACEEKEILQAQDIQSVLVVPLVHQRSLVGFLGLDAVRSRLTWTEEDITMLKIIGEVIANTLEHRRMFDTLQTSEARLASAQRIARLGSWEWDIAGNEVRFCDGTRRIFDLVPQKSGATYEAAINTVHPDDRKYVEESIAEALKERKPCSIEYRIVLEDGAERVVHVQAEATFDDLGKPVRMAGTVQDITERVKIEAALRESSGQLKRAIEETIQAVAKLVEMRDPYTAGHQRRVAELACLIAKEMGLSKERIEGLRFAALIHDVGKIHVPAGILNKPGGLYEAELSLIKMHPLVGYDVLKSINFQWPVAQIVLQHHERLDGSGYPQGLSADDILLEAQILGVADTVEAMASHRPYRPAKGIDQALEQLTKDKGVLFNPDVVDACLRLFTSRGFRFSDDDGSNRVS